MIGRKSAGHAGPFHQVAADRWPVSTHTHTRLRPPHRRWGTDSTDIDVAVPRDPTVHWHPRSSAGWKRHGRSEVDIRWPWQNSPTTHGDGAEGRVARQRPEAAHPSDHGGRYLDDLRHAGAGQGTTVCHPSLPPPTPCTAAAAPSSITRLGTWHHDRRRSRSGSALRARCCSHSPPARWPRWPRVLRPPAGSPVGPSDAN